MKLLKKQVKGNVIRSVYTCPCGNGIIQEEQDYTLDHRDGIAFLLCEKCKHSYYIDFKNSQTKWELKK